MIGHKRYGSREGGVEVVVTELARRMVELGHEVTCYDRSGSDVMTGCAADCRGRVIDGVHVVPVKTIDKKASLPFRHHTLPPGPQLRTAPM